MQTSAKIQIIYIGIISEKLKLFISNIEPSKNSNA